MENRIHIFGPSGVGATTLGGALANRLDIIHLDSDDFYWEESEIPYTRERKPAERAEILGSEMRKYQNWVSSGSLCGWGDFAIPLFTLAVFLWIPEDVRLIRLEKREIDRYGTDAVLPGGWFYQNSQDFLAYASKYDKGGLDIRSRALHEKWMEKLPCRLLRMEEEYPSAELVSLVLDEQKHRENSTR